MPVENRRGVSELVNKMKIIDGFMLREIAGEYVAVPSGEAAQVFNGLLTLNETGAEVFRRLQEGTDREALLAALAADYDVPRPELEADVDELLDRFRELAILKEAVL